MAGVQEPESEAEGVKAAQWSDVDSHDVDMDSTSWCFAALNNPRGRAGTLLVDFGADGHICHSEFAKESPLKKSAGVTLRDVQGNPSSHHGTRHVNQSVGTRGQRANIDFQIADISDNKLSLGKLLRNGFVFKLRRSNESILYHHRDPTTTVPLFLHKNSLRIRANPIVHHVSPVMEDDMPVRLFGQSPLRLLDRRLDKLELPEHGKKLDKWTRIEQRENELMRERKSQPKALVKDGFHNMQMSSYRCLEKVHQKPAKECGSHGRFTNIWNYSIGEKRMDMVIVSVDDNGSH